MTRTPAILAVAAAVSLWASAQTPTSVSTAAEQLKLLRTNRVLLEDLINHGLKLSDANTLVDRAEECRRASRTLSDSLKWEAENQADPTRVAELGDHLASLVGDGLAPALGTAERTIPPQSEDYKRLQQVRQTADRDLRDIADAIPTTGKLGQSKQVQDARTRLGDAVRQLSANE